DLLEERDEVPPQRTAFPGRRRCSLTRRSSDSTRSGVPMERRHGDLDAPQAKSRDRASLTSQRSVILEECMSLPEKRTAVLERRTAVLERRTAVLERRTAVLEDRGAVLEKLTVLTEKRTVVLLKRSASLWRHAVSRAKRSTGKPLRSSPLEKRNVDRE